MDRSVAFYRDVLGLSPAYTSPYWSEFDLGNGKIALHPPLGAGTGPTNTGSGWFLGVRTEDISGLKARLQSSGAAIVADYHDTPSGVVLTFADPDGNPIQAIQLGIKTAELA
jgi:predicted enzyme related to lactoylglutathione lyase